VQESVAINLAAITNENVYSTQAMDALLYIRIGNELVAGAEQKMADDMLSLHVSCQHRFSLLLRQPQKAASDVAGSNLCMRKMVSISDVTL